MSNTRSVKQRSFTERKRIRKSFGKREIIHKAPHLLDDAKAFV